MQDAVFSSSFFQLDLQVVQKRGMRIIHPELSYEQALAKSDLCPLLTTRRDNFNIDSSNLLY